MRSKIEKISADFLTASDLTFVYEPQLKIGNLFFITIKLGGIGFAGGFYMKAA